MFSILQFRIGENDLEAKFNHTVRKSMTINVYAKTDIPPLIDSKLRSNLITLHRNGKFADIRLQIGDNIIPAHKCILASRSLKFKMLFESQMQDSPSSIANQFKGVGTKIGGQSQAKKCFWSP